MSVISNNASRGHAIAQAILPQLKEHLLRIEHIDAGSTSEVYRVGATRSEYVLRVANPNSGKTGSYLTDCSIRKVLYEAGLPVASPIVNDQTLPVEFSGHWALDRFCEGNHPQRGRIPSAISKQLGKLLKALHSLSASGFGRLEASTDRFHGKYINPHDGLLSRFEAPWPFTGRSLAAHPSVLSEPILFAHLSSIENELKEFGSKAVSAVVHGDLHEAQFLIEEDKLIALLDFNDAMVGRPEWDFGSYFYFHGKTSLNELLEAYTDDVAVRSIYANEALYAAILIALHHGNRGAVLGKPHRIEASVRFLREQLVRQ